ncbi:MAG: marine proteobacterial sortase target protein [Caulobacterales bacterium]
MLPRRFEAFGLSVLLGWTALAGFAAFSASAQADTPPGASVPQPRLVTIDDIGTGALLFKTKEDGKYIEAPTVAADVKMDVSGPVIRSKVTQRFTNPSKKWVEAVYVFPLPEDSGVDTLKVIVGDRFIEGKIKERAEAKAIYEQAKREGKKAGLLEQERPNMFTTSVANIGPGETVAIQFEYQDTVKVKDGAWGVRFPLVVGPRYIPDPRPAMVADIGPNGFAVKDPVPDADRVTPPVMNPKNEPAGTIRLPVTMSIDVKAGFPIDRIESTSHAIKIDKKNSTESVITLKDDQVPANRDFTLSWRGKPGADPKAGLFYETYNGETYVLAMVAPPAAPKATKVRPRETVFVIDNSGSMSGPSMEEAKKSLLFALGRLKPTDTFNVIRFDDTMDVLYPQVVPASADNVTKAKNFVAALEATGGTEMLAPMKAALVDPNPGDKSRVRQVVFITDGDIGNENEVLQAVATGLGRSRIFTVGIGTAPNTFFMTRAARTGRGFFTYIDDIAKVEEQSQILFTALESPVMTDLKAQLPSNAQVETYPSPLPDLYAGEPVVLTAKLPSKSGNVRVSADLNGKNWAVDLPMDKAAPATGLAKLWARAKIEDIEEGQFENVDQAKIDDGVLKTALAYNLVSRRTSLVATDVTPTRPAGEPTVRNDVPTMLPAGWDFDKVFGKDIMIRIQTAPQMPDELIQTLYDEKAEQLAAAEQGLDLPAGGSPWDSMILIGLLLMAGGVWLVWIERRKAQA